MSRHRTVKPSYWSSEQVMALSRDARLLFIGIWNFADDTGRFKLAPLTLKAQIFPSDNDVTKLVVESWLSEIIRVGLVECYTNGRELFGEVTGWKKHQKIDKPQPSKHPGSDAIESVRRTFDEYTAIVRGELATERESRERGVEKRGESAPARAREAELQPSEQTEPAGHQPPSPPTGPLAGSLTAALADLSRPASDREAMLAEAETLVRVEFARRFEAAEGSLWTRSGDPAVATLAAWALSVHGGPEAAVKRLLDNFFADPWVASEKCCFDVRHLARHPQKYFNPRKAPVAHATVDVDTEIAKLRSQRDQLFERLNDARARADGAAEARVQASIDALNARIRALKGGE